MDVPMFADQQKLKLCADTVCSLEDLPEALDDWDGWRESHGNSCSLSDLMIILELQLLRSLQFWGIILKRSSKLLKLLADFKKWNKMKQGLTIQLKTDLSALTLSLPLGIFIERNTWCNGYLWRCPWCNGNRRRNWTQRHEFKSWTRMIAFHIALIPLGKVWIQLFFLQLWVNSRAD